MDRKIIIVKMQNVQAYDRIRINNMQYRVLSTSNELACLEELGEDYKGCFDKMDIFRWEKVA